MSVILRNVAGFSFIVALAWLPQPLTAATITYVYDVGTQVTSNPLSSDNWTGTSVASWVEGAFDSDFYTRNQTGGGTPANDADNSIFRANDGNFSYTIPSNASFVSLEIKARRGSHFWQAGLATGNSTTLGIGSNFGGGGNGSKYFILDQFNRLFESGATAVGGDVYDILRLDLDVTTMTADLTLNNSTLLIDDVALTSLTSSELQAANGLFVRTVSRFVGPAHFTLNVTTIPEPMSFALFGVAFTGLGVVLLRRRCCAHAG